MDSLGRCDKEKIMLRIRAALNNRLLIPIEQKYPHLVLLQLYNHYSTGMFLKMTLDLFQKYKENNF